MNRIPFVVLTGVVGGTIGTVLYSYEAGALFAIERLPEFAIEHWRALVGAWLSFYGTAVLLVGSAAVLRRARKTPYLTPKERAQDFLYQLVINQYFSCLVLLFILGSAGLLLQQTGSSSIALPFAPFLVVVGVGLLTWSVGSATILFGISAVEPTTDLTAHEQLGPGLPVYRADVERELQNLAGLIQQQRPLIEATRDTAAALYDLGKTIHVNLSVLSDRGQERSSDFSAENLHTAVCLLEEAIRELRVIRGSLESAEEARAGQTEGIDRFDLAQASLETGEEARTGHHRTEGEGIDRSDLAQELQDLKKLLEQMPSFQLGASR